MATKIKIKNAISRQPWFHNEIHVNGMDRWLSAIRGELQLLLNDPITVNSSTMVKEAKEQVTKHTQQ